MYIKTDTFGFFIISIDKKNVNRRKHLNTADEN